MRILLSFLILMLLVNLYAQNVPNGDFEIWSIDTFYEEPELYNTSNQLAFSGAGITNVNKITDAIDGNFAARLETISTFQGNGAGTIFNGTFSINPPEVYGGHPYTQRPTSISYHARYHTVENDTAFVLVGFKVSGFPLGVAIDTIIGSQNEYIERTVNVIWYTTVLIPDSVITAVSSSSFYNPKVGNWIEIDNIIFNDVTQPCPNGSFENWEDFSNEEAPGWLSSNFFTIPVSDTSVKKTDDSYEGNYAVRIESFPTIWEDTLGFITNGFLGPDGSFGGIPVDQIPETLSGYYKYEPVENDTAIATITLYHYNSGTHQTDILEQKILKLTATEDYTYFEIPIDYATTPYPDTVNIAFGASNFLLETTNVGQGSILYIDDVDLTFKPIGVESHQSQSEVTIFPNPVQNILKVFYNRNIHSQATFNVYNAMGILISSKTFNKPNIEYNTQLLDSGIYFYKILHQGEVVTGSFVVQ